MRWPDPSRRGRAWACTRTRVPRVGADAFPVSRPFVRALAPWHGDGNVRDA